MKDNFEQSAWEAFQEAAAEKYDFATCQRSDGSKYGTGGQCRKGTPTTPGSDDKKPKGDGGKARKEAKASGEVADRKAAARKENESKKIANARTDSKMSSARAAEIKAKFDRDRRKKK